MVVADGAVVGVEATTPGRGDPSGAGAEGGDLRHRRVQSWLASHPRIHYGGPAPEPLAMIADELEGYFQQCADREAFSGVVLITQGSSQLFAGTYGYASRSWKTPNRLTTRFDTASVTKLFTAVATLQLIDNEYSPSIPPSLSPWDCGTPPSLGR